jgi:transcriptional regulator with XRE-family HTH domain
MTEMNVLERIRALMTERNVKQNDLAATLGVSEAVVSRLLNGERKLSAAELGAIADRLRTTTGYLLGRTTADVRPFAVAARLGSTEHAAELDPVFARARTLLELRGVLSRLVESPAREAGVRVERPSTSMYKLAGDQMGERLRAALGLGDEPIDDLVELTEGRFGVDVSLEPLPEALHGVFITDPTPAEGDARLAVMLVNSTDTYGRQRFTLAHELGHLLFEDADLYWADYRKDDSKSLTELRANHFASAFLMPAGGVRVLVSDLGPAPEETRARHEWLARLVVETSLRFGVSVDAAIYRLDNLKVWTPSDKTFAKAQSATSLIDMAGRNEARARLAEFEHVVAPPPVLRDQALFAYAEGMVGIEPLAQLWKSEDAEALRVELADAGWVPAYA